MSASQTYVVFRLSALGDIMLTTGPLNFWNEKRDAEFIYITRKGLEPILQKNPAIKEIITLAPHELKGLAWLTTARNLALRFKNLPLLDLHGTLRSHVLSALWQGPVKRYPKKALARRLYNKTKNRVWKHELEKHNVPQRYSLALEFSAPAQEELLPKLTLDQYELDAVKPHLPASSNKKPLIALHPYATHPGKAWPRDHWKQLIKLIEENDMQWMVVGKDKTPLCPGNAQDLTNKTDLRETAALLQHANALITNDSGPMHIASAVGTPVIALFGPTSKAWGFYPAGKIDRVLERDISCRPCSLHGKYNCKRNHACLDAICPHWPLTALINQLKAQE
ncbi:MAG: glycosyltransferase family 9 protein [Desulfovibrio sp.]